MQPTPETAALIAELHRMAEQIGCRFVPAAWKVERFEAPVEKEERDA